MRWFVVQLSLYLLATMGFISWFFSNQLKDMTGKQWTAKEEVELKALADANLNVDEIAVKIQKTPRAIMTKAQRLGLQLQTDGYVNTSIAIPNELPSVEEAIKILAGALKASIKPGLNRTEVQRLQAVANISKIYKELITDYMHYREVEHKLEDLEEQNAQLQQTLKEIKERSPSSPSQPVSG